MSRIRSVHPGFFRDDRLVPCSAFARLLFIGLGVEADDKGIFEWKPVTLKMSIFPGDNIDVPELLGELLGADAIMQFEANGKTYGAIRNFRKYQKPKTPNDIYPMPDRVAGYVAFPQKGETQTLEPEAFPQNGENERQMEEGGGNRKVEDKPPASVVEAVGAREEFDELLEVFPRNPRCPEDRAEAAWRATKAKDRPLILAAARRHALAFAEECEERQRTPDAGKRYEPFLATWIESGAWKQPIKLKADRDQPDPSLEVLPRTDPLVAILERKRGKPFAAGLEKITARKADVEAARLELH